MPDTDVVLMIRALTPFPARDYRADPCYEAGQCPT